MKSEIVKFKDFATIVAGQSPKSEHYSTKGGFPFLQGNRTFGHLYPTIDTYTSKITKTASKGEILMSVRAPVGALNFANQDLCIGRGLAAIQAKNGNNAFLFYNLKYNIQRLIQRSSGTTYDSVTKDQINDFDLVVPVKNQDKISDLLMNIDFKIELNNKKNAQLESMAKLIYDYWFVQFDFPDENGNPYKSSGGKMVYNEELKREIPEGWVVSSLLDVATFTNGIACQKYRPEAGDESLKVIKIREMRTGFTEDSELVKASIPERVKVYNGDLLFSWSASLLVKLWSGGNGALNQHIFKVTSNRFPQSFILMELQRYLSYFQKVAELRKTTMGHITREHLKDSRIAVPPSYIIQMLDAKLKPVYEKVINSNIESNQLENLRDWLLPMLMNGQVTIKD